MILTPRNGMMTRHRAPSNIEKAGMKVLVQGRGPRDPKIARMPKRLQGALRYMLKDAAKVLKHDINNLVWRIDKGGCIHVTDPTIKVQ